MTDRRTIDTINSDQLDQLYDRAEQAETAIARIAALAEEHPAGIDTALIHAELDTTGAPSPAATEATDTEDQR